MEFKYHQWKIKLLHENMMRERIFLWPQCIPSQISYELQKNIVTLHCQILVDSILTMFRKHIHTHTYIRTLLERGNDKVKGAKY